MVQVLQEMKSISADHLLVEESLGNRIDTLNNVQHAAASRTEAIAASMSTAAQAVVNIADQLAHQQHQNLLGTEQEVQKSVSPDESGKQYDVFLCYESKDRSAVMAIGEQLKAHGIVPWLDEWELPPGESWWSVMENQISRIRSAAVFIGKGDAGPWQDEEQRVLLREFVKMKYISGLWQTWIYILFSSVGSVGFTVFLATNGAKVVQDPRWNAIFFGILGSAIFLGLASRVAVSESSNRGVERQLKTLQEYVYGVLDESISRKKLQLVELKIRDACSNVDPESFEEEAISMLEALDTLTRRQKDELRAKFDEFVTREEYAPVMRELKRHYDVDYVIERLSAEVGRRRRQSRLYNLINVSLETHGLRNAVIPEFIMAKVQALQKDPDSSLDYLEQALQKKPTLKSSIPRNETDWRILISMTHGEQQREKLEQLLSLIGIEQLTLENIRQQCMHQHRLPVTFIAVKKTNGDCVKITLKMRDNHTHSIGWWIRSDGDRHLHQECTSMHMTTRLSIVILSRRICSSGGTMRFY